MEPTSRSFSLPFPKNLRPKQIEVIKAFETRNDLVIQLPVGYGKTLTAAGSFAQLRHRNSCNRILQIVPRIAQATQVAESLPDDLKQFGIVTKSLIVGDNQIPALRAHAADEICCFVTTIQSLLSRSTWNCILDLLSTGRWFIVIDEHHHFSTYDAGDSKWTEKIKGLNASAQLAMSATPNRRDGSDHFPEPHIKETYRNAAEAGYVKRLSLHAYEYQVDAVMTDGGIISYTTEELMGEAGSETPEAIDAFLTARKMRFSPKYVSPLVTFPIGRLIDLRMRNLRAQMLIQAMSCNHAQCIVEQVRNLIPDSMKVDWVGTGPNGRRGDENKEVLNKFCPPKDKITKKRPWTLDVLVNVGIAGEGLDSMDVAETTFLTPANITTSNLQTIGRSSRIMLTGGAPQPQAHVNVDTGSPMATYVGNEVELLFDTDIKPTDENTSDEKDSSTTTQEPYEELPETMGWAIADVRLINIRSLPIFDTLKRETERELSLERKTASTQEIEDAAVRALEKHLNSTNDEGAILAQMKDNIDGAVAKIAGLILRRMNEQNMRPQQSLSGDLKRKINSQKAREFGGKIGHLTRNELENQYTWLRQLERTILMQQNLQGLPRWLK